jgi:hypothetical protein
MILNRHFRHQVMNNSRELTFFAKYHLVTKMR